MKTPAGTAADRPTARRAGAPGRRRDRAWSRRPGLTRCGEALKPPKKSRMCAGPTGSGANNFFAAVRWCSCSAAAATVPPAWWCDAPAASSGALGLFAADSRRGQVNRRRGRRAGQRLALDQRSRGERVDRGRTRAGPTEQLIGADGRCHQRQDRPRQRPRRRLAGSALGSGAAGSLGSAIGPERPASSRVTSRST